MGAIFSPTPFVAGDSEGCRGALASGGTSGSPGSGFSPVCALERVLAGISSHVGNSNSEAMTAGVDLDALLAAAAP